MNLDEIEQAGLGIPTILLIVVGFLALRWLEMSSLAGIVAGILLGAIVPLLVRAYGYRLSKTEQSVLKQEEKEESIKSDAELLRNPIPLELNGLRFDHRLTDLKIVMLHSWHYFFGEKLGLRHKYPRIAPQRILVRTHRSKGKVQLLVYEPTEYDEILIKHGLIDVVRRARFPFDTAESYAMRRYHNFEERRPTPKELHQWGYKN